MYKDDMGRMTTVTSVSIYSIGQALELYASSSHASKKAYWQRVDWIWNSLAWYEKVAFSLGLCSFTSWREKIIFPVLARASRPILERYMRGEFRRQDEERLMALSAFFADRIKDTQKLYDQKLVDFLQKRAVWPSFTREKEIWRERLAELPSQERNKARPVLQWQRYETFANYRQRLLACGTGSMPNGKEGEKARLQGKAPSYEDTYAREAFRKKKAEYDRLSHVVKNSVEKLVDNIASLRSLVYEKLMAKAILLRYEDKEILGQAKALFEMVMTLLISAEDAHELALEHASKEVESMDGLQREIESFQKLSQEIAAAEEEKERLAGVYFNLEKRCEKISASVNHSVLSLFRTIDAIPLLPTGSLLRTHEMRLIKMAREKLKQYRYLSTKPPGPSQSFQQVEKDVKEILDLARAFYKEGKEIEEIRARLKSMSHTIEELVRDRDEPSQAPSISVQEGSQLSQNERLRGILNKISMMDRDLEVITDRRERFQGVIEELSLCHPSFSP